jgi:nucleotide-binding universal stress UspA family protein
MSFKKILIPTDGSEYTKVAIQKGLTLANQIGAEVTALYVMDQTPFVNMPVDSTTVTIHSILKDEGRMALDYVKNLGEEMGVKVDALIEDGFPVRNILDHSKNFDLIVMGTLGRSGVSKLLMGSVAEKVVRHADCPVMVVRAHEVD